MGSVVLDTDRIDFAGGASLIVPAVQLTLTSKPPVSHSSAVAEAAQPMV
jgi:hypothetical protein